MHFFVLDQILPGGFVHIAQVKTKYGQAFRAQFFRDSRIFGRSRISIHDNVTNRNFDAHICIEVNIEIRIEAKMHEIRLPILIV